MESKYSGAMYNWVMKKPESNNTYIESLGQKHVNAELHNVKFTYVPRLEHAVMFNLKNTMEWIDVDDGRSEYFVFAYDNSMVFRRTPIFL